MSTPNPDEKTSKHHSSPDKSSPAPPTSTTPAPPSQENGQNVLADQYRRQRYTNSLLVAVGYLEFCNSLDFPANVWNVIPVPTFAVCLMAIGGSVAILTSAFAFWDLHRARRNVRFLREERRDLKQRRDSLLAVQRRGEEEIQKPERLERLRLVNAWLEVSFREIGWEIADRILMDLFLGVTGILIGVGTILAIGGANRKIFLASNLLSGYIGNSLMAPYALANAVWSSYMWRSARQHTAALSKAKGRVEAAVRLQMRSNARKHQIYASVNGISVLISSVGSIVSATMWQGYVVLIPCVISSIFCNWFWRKKLGYDRDSFDFTAGSRSFDIEKTLKAVTTVQSALSGKPANSADLFGSIFEDEKTSQTAILNLIQDLGLHEDFCLEMMRHQPSIEKSFGSLDSTMPLDLRKVEFADEALVVRTAQSCITKFGRRHVERFLLELNACYLHYIEIE